MTDRIDESLCGLLGDFFTIFAHPTRMGVFCALQHGPQTVTKLAEYTDVSIQNISQHLRLMRDKGAVVTDKQGQFVHYRIADERFTQAARLIAQALIDNAQRRAAAMRPAPPAASDAAGSA